MDPSTGFPPGFQVVQLTAPLLLCNLFAWGLFGALTVQVYLYYQAFPNDRLTTKSLVYCVYTIELLAIVLQTHDAFETFGYGFNNILAATTIKLGWLDIPVISGVVALMGQSFYAYRVHVLSKSWILPAVILVVALTSSLGALLAGVFSFEPNINIASLSTPRLLVAIWVWCGASALTDILIAASMTYYLSTKVTEFRRTRALVSRLIRLTLETGSLTAVLAVTNLILFLAFPDKTYYIIPTVLMARFYAICILAVLNARCEIVGGRGYAGQDAISSYLGRSTTHTADTNGTSRHTHSRCYFGYGSARPSGIETDPRAREQRVSLNLH
ncbi:hypothetical protein DFH06DRAFT_1222376 [Mycena polygramma]|nr:hypothetical protein DFH06DRAFT_1222376 [Mycena polygramma]